MNILRKGCHGSVVSMAQLALKRAGFYSGKADGCFGHQTLQAVRQLQRACRMHTDGIISDAVMTALEKYIKGYFRYTMRRGDTYWLLANKYGTSVRSIMLANPDINENFLRVGQVIVIPFGYRAVPTCIPYSSYLLSYVVEGLKVRFPFLEVTVEGKSISGRDIYCIKIGKGENEIFANAAHHANEWITTPVLLKFLEEYAWAYSRESDICGFSARELYAKTTLYVFPMVNPDGVDLVTGALCEGALYENARKIAESFPDISFPRGWKANILGTDLNLNYPAEWEAAREIKYSMGYSVPAPKNFTGTSPLSEPESLSVYDFTRRHDFKMILAYHTQGRVIYPGYSDCESGCGRQTAEVLHEVSGYSVEMPPHESSFAGYKDWFVSSCNRPGYTIEAGVGENPLPLCQLDEIYRDNKQLLAAALEQCSKNHYIP